MFCRGCGENIPVDSVFCPSCGKNLLNVDAAAQPQAVLPPSRPLRRFHIRDQAGRHPLRNLDGPAAADGATPAAGRGRAPRQKIWNLSERVGQSGRPGFQYVAGFARSAFRIKFLPTEGVLFYGGVGFGVVGFVLAALSLPASGWLGFGIILVLGAIYWQGRLPDGSQPHTQTEGKEMTQ